MKIYTVGRRKEAKARALIESGVGAVRVNGEHVRNLPDMLRLKVIEPLLVAGEPDEVDISVNVRGGGQSGQADAARTAIARALVSYYTDTKDLESTFMAYDRYMLVEDSRRTEPHKPSQSSKGPRHKQQKSYR